MYVALPLINADKKNYFTVLQYFYSIFYGISLKCTLLQ